jgi:hypothetical protein
MVLVVLVVLFTQEVGDLSPPPLFLAGGRKVQGFELRALLLA